MSSIKIIDGDLELTLEAESVGIEQLFVLATDAMDHRRTAGTWLPQQVREQWAAKQASN